VPRWINLANLLTLLRLLLVPAVVEAILAGRHGLAVILLVAASVTDVLDGWAARRLGLGTDVGAYLDPIADKCLLSGIFLALAMSGGVPWWFVGIVFGRDIYILLAAGAFMLWTPVRKFPPSIWGKASTFVQISTAVTCMTRNLISVPLIASLAVFMVWVSAAFTVWSGIHYGWRGIRMLRAH
jgi:cardiolipin synthase